MFIVVIVISLQHCTMHSRYWFVQVQVQVLVFYAFCLLEKKFNRTQSLPILEMWASAQRDGALCSTPQFG